MTVFNILEPQISTVTKGLDGKVILVYGSNSLGKTSQGARMEKPLVLPFEQGLNAISGVPYFPINSWSDFKKINLSLTNPRTLPQVKEKYQTILFDEINASAIYCQEYICAKYEADSIASGNGGYGLWKEYETEYWREINRLTKAGFTVYFIAHEQVDRDSGQARPKGDKRSLDPIVDLADVTIYLASNGIDENGKVVRSSGYLAETPEYFARSRFEYIDTYMEEYTAENLEKFLVDAVEREEKAKGIKAVTFEEKSEVDNTELSYDELMEAIKAQYMRLSELGELEKYQEIVEDELGEGAIASEASKKQVQSLDLILFNLRQIQ